MGFAFAFGDAPFGPGGSFTTHASFPVFASNARKRPSLVAPTNTSPPPVTVGPALPLLPTSCLPGGSASLRPSGVSQTICPVFALTAISFDHGGRWHGSDGPIGVGAPPGVRGSLYFPLSGAENVKNGPTPFTLARSYG